MSEPSNPQRHQFGCLDVLALVAAAGAAVALVMPAVQAHRPVLVAVTIVVGLLLVPVFFVAAWYLMIGLIVAALWLFAVDRDLPPTAEPVFPAGWWDFRPFLVIVVVGGAWMVYGLPLLGHLRWGEWDDWPAVIAMAAILPTLLIGLAARRWLPARFRPPRDPTADPPAGPSSPAPG